MLTFGKKGCIFRERLEQKSTTKKKTKKIDVAVDLLKKRLYIYRNR